MSGSALETVNLDNSLEDELGEDSEDDDDELGQEFCGHLLKWTNYVHGWQDRYFILKNGCLSYFKSEEETRVGSRGSVSLARAVIKQHEFDELRFDIGVNDAIWHLRAKDKEERSQWLDLVDSHKQALAALDSGVGSLSRHGSLFSLTSMNSISSLNQTKTPAGRHASASTANKLQSHLTDLRVLRDLLTTQVENLQRHFDSVEANMDRRDSHTCSFESSLGDSGKVDSGDYNSAVSSNHTTPADLSAIRADAMTFKSTSSTLLETVQSAVETLSSQEDRLKARLDKEVERRKKLEEAYKTLLRERMVQGPAIDGPDYQEGPHSNLTDELWYDALESAMEKLDEDSGTPLAGHRGAAAAAAASVHSSVKKPLSIGDQRMKHRLSEQCDLYVKENLNYAFNSDAKDLDGWELMHSEGEMKVYRKEVEIDGVVLDPLKATHQVEGVTAGEMTHYFFDPDYKLEWEGHLLDSMKVVEILAPDTVIVHSVMKRVWPSATRDMVYLSHIRHVCPMHSDNQQNDTWIVTNYSTDANIPLAKGGLRCQVRASMVCQTILKRPPPAHGKITREHICTKVWYTADVNPGGWAPAKILRQVYKHEYPKFLLKFGEFVQGKTRDTDPCVPTEISAGSP